MEGGDLEHFYLHGGRGSQLVELFRFRRAIVSRETIAGRNRNSSTSRGSPAQRKYHIHIHNIYGVTGGREAR